MNYLFVFLGGGLGSMTRYFLSDIKLPYLSQFPGGTFTSNLISCLILGFLIQSFAGSSSGNVHWKLLLVVGFCGGFSTFSTFSLEIFEKIAAGDWSVAIFYILASVIFGLLAIYLGMQLMRIIN